MGYGTVVAHQAEVVVGPVEVLGLATPLTLGQEFSGYAAQIRNGIRRVQDTMPALLQLAQGGTAVGTGINAKVGFDKKFAAHVAKITGFPSKAALTIAVVDTLFDVAAESSRKRIANIKPEDDVIQGMIEDASEFFLGKDFSMGLDLLASAERDPELRDGVRTAAKRTRFLVEDMWIGLLLSRGLPRDDAEDVLWLTFSAIRGLAVRMLWQFDQDRFDRLKKTTYRAARDLYEEKRRIPTLKKSRNSGEEN